MKSTVIERLIVDARDNGGARIMRYGSSAALGVSLPGHHRYDASGISAAVLVRVEWLAPAGHDDDPGSVSGTYLRPFGDAHRVVAREHGIDPGGDLPADLVRDMKRARIAV